MRNWGSSSRWGSVEQRRLEREQRARDARAEASREYLADIAGDGGGCDFDCGDD